MPINIATQINFLLSGGSNNNNPNKSLGSLPSSFPVVGTTNSLFADITTEEAQVGKTDYRCFYLKNTSAADSLFNTAVFIYSQNSLGSTVQIGVGLSTDEQEIQISNSVSSGHVMFKYKQSQLFVSWGGSINSFANNLVSALNSAGVQGSEISVLGNRIRVLFKGSNNFKNHPLLEIFSNNLEGITKPIVEVRKITEGQPINSIAPLIEAETIIPSKVQFFNTSPTEKINLGQLSPGDFVPIWIKRTTAPETNFEENDYFTLKITGSPFV